MEKFNDSISNQLAALYEERRLKNSADATSFAIDKAKREREEEAAREEGRRKHEALANQTGELPSGLSEQAET